MRVFILRLVIFFGLLFPALASADTPISDARVFAFAEANYPSLFSGTVTDGQYQQYDYRYYLNNRNYLAIDTTGMIYIMGSATGGVISPVGTVASFANTIIAWEATQTSSLQWNLGYWDTQKWN